MTDTIQISKQDLKNYREIIAGNLDKLQKNVNSLKDIKSVQGIKAAKDLNRLVRFHRDLLKETDERIKNFKTVKNPFKNIDDLVEHVKEMYKGFHHKTDVTVKQENLKYPEILLFIGAGKKLFYTSDKRLYGDTKERDYVHDFKKHGNIYVGINKVKGGYVISMIIIKDLNIRVKPEGIVG